MEEFKQVYIIVKSSEGKPVVIGSALLIEEMNFDCAFEMLRRMAEEAIFEFLKELKLKRKTKEKKQ